MLASLVDDGYSVETMGLGFTWCSRALYIYLGIFGNRGCEFVTVEADGEISLNLGIRQGLGVE